MAFNADVGKRDTFMTSMTNKQRREKKQFVSLLYLQTAMPKDRIKVLVTANKKLKHFLLYFRQNPLK